MNLRSKTKNVRLHGHCVAWMTVALLLPAKFGTAQQTSTNAFATRSIGGSDVLNVVTELSLASSMTFGTAKTTISCSTGRSKADRNLEVVFYLANSRSGSAKALAYHKLVTLPEGSTSVEVEIPHVQSGSNTGYSGTWAVEVRENGRDIENKRQRNTQTRPYALIQRASNLEYRYGTIVGPNETQPIITPWLVAITGIDPTIPPTAMATVGYGGGGYAGVTNPGLYTNNRWEQKRVVDASSDWRTYLSYPFWMVSAQTLDEISTSRPEVLSALLSYVASGGRVLVHSAADYSSRETLDQILGSSTDNNDINDHWQSLRSPKDPWWKHQDERTKILSNGLNGQTVYVSPNQKPNTLAQKRAKDQAANKLQQLGFDGAIFDSAIAAETWAKGKLSAPVDTFLDLKEALSEGGYGGEYYEGVSLGEIRHDLLSTVATDEVLQRTVLNGQILIAEKSPNQLPDALLNQAVTAQDHKHISGIIGHDYDGNWFWRNMIAAVGKPPVWIFCAVVTLFGLLLGPGLLVFTAWMRRRSLMIFLVPVVAMIATGAIITYGVLHEGFENHIRVISVKSIDPATGNGFVWSRQNYFCGFPPRDGIAFRADTFVRPVYAESDRNWYSYSDPRDNVDANIIVSDHQRWIGWIRPRQHQQLLVGHTVQKAAMPIGLSADDSGNLLITNTTDERLPLVVVRGKDLDYFFASDVDAKETVSISPVDQATAESKVARAMADLKSKPPPELQGGGSLLNFGRQSSYTLTEDTDVINLAFEQNMSDNLDMRPFGFAVLQSATKAIEIPFEGEKADDMQLVIGVRPW